MKKTIFAATAILIAVVLAVFLLSDRLPTEAPDTSVATTSQSTAAPTSSIPATSIIMTPTGSSIVTVPPAPTTLPPEPAVVRLYTCDAAHYETYLALAAEYYAETGTEVIILTPGERSCEEALADLLAQDSSPTLFCLHSQDMLEQVQHTLYDLTGTAPAAQLYSQAFSRTQDGKLLALAVDVGGSGLIYNASKLAAAGFSATDISNFAGLQTTVKHITANKSSLGYAFAAPDFTNEHLMEHLAGLYPDADQLRAFVDLYFKNCTVKTTTLQYFTGGTTVFYIGGTADYDAVCSIGSNNLRFLPAYSQDTATVQCFSSHFWAVNASASEADIQATLDFWSWLVTAQNGATPIDRLEMLSPYQQATYFANILEEKLRQYISDGNVYLTWTLSGKVTDLDAFTSALKAYAASSTDENWAAVAVAFADFHS